MRLSCRRIVLFCTFLLLASNKSHAGNRDSLLQVLPLVKTETERLFLMYLILDDPNDKKLEHTLYYHKKLLELTRKEDDKAGEAVVTGALGYALALWGNTTAGTELLFKGIKMAEDAGSQQVTGMCYNGLSILFVEDRTKQKSFIHKALEASMAAKDSMFIMYEYSNLSTIYLREGKLDSALYFNQKTIEISTVLKQSIPFSLVRAGEINYEWGRKGLALEYYRTALNEFWTDPNASRFDLAPIYGSLSNYFLSEGQPDSALHYASLQYQSLSDAYFIKRAPGLLSLWKVFEKTNSDSALKYASQYFAIKDSMYSINNVRQMEVMAMLDEERQQTLEAERRNNLQYVAIVLGLIALVSIFLLLSHSIIANQNMIRFLGVISLLIVFEFLNLLLHPYLANLTHHSPILMLLIMVCIAALLVPLHHKTEHWAIHKLVEKNKRIRLAAAKKTIRKMKEEADIVKHEETML